MGTTINLNQLAAEIKRQLQEYTSEVKDAVMDIALDISADAVAELKEKSPSRTEKYKKSWTRAVDRSGVTIYSRAPEYRLTHLLEKGHALKRGGRKVGEVPAYPHIQKVEEECVNRYISEVEGRLGE